LSFRLSDLRVSNDPEPFGLESFDPELTTEGLMAERQVEGERAVK
jgi:hypothetical protein